MFKTGFRYRLLYFLFQRMKLKVHWKKYVLICLHHMELNVNSLLTSTQKLLLHCWWKKWIQIWFVLLWMFVLVSKYILWLFNVNIFQISNITEMKPIFFLAHVVCDDGLNTQIPVSSFMLYSFSSLCLIYY